MKKVERSARREVRATVLLFAGTVTALVLFGLILWTAIMSIDGARGLYKTSPDAPESLVSLGAPRSQLDLLRMFSSMRSEYNEVGGTVCEPITAEYRKSVEERIAAGERQALSVEEILYIISDSVEMYNSYDLVRLISSDGTVDAAIEPIKELSEENVPYYVAAQKKAEDVMRIITYRIFSLSSPEVMVKTDEGYLYIPEYTEREGARSFTISDVIAFNTDNGGTVKLYPTEKITESCHSTVLIESKRALGRAEREVIIASGYDVDAARNVTPEYMYGKTDLRLVALGGRVVIVDINGYAAVDVLPKSERLTSVAILGGSLYFTSSDGSGSSLWIYEIGKGAERIFESDEEYIGIYDDGETLGLYAANKLESKKYITLLVRSGEPIMMIEK